MFDIQILDSTEASVYIAYETKGAPNITTLIHIAKLFKFDFEMEYVEGNSLVGEYQYNLNGNELWGKELDQDVLVRLEETDYDSMCEELDKLNYELKDLE